MTHSVHLKNVRRGAGPAVRVAPPLLELGVPVPPALLLPESEERPPPPAPPQPHPKAAEGVVMATPSAMTAAAMTILTMAYLERPIRCSCPPAILVRVSKRPSDAFEFGKRVDSGPYDPVEGRWYEPRSS